MRVSFEILRRDLLALAKNPIALLVTVALLILPGLYAWYCIIANWDPYSNTGNMPIAVVNQDKGTSSSLTGEINIGEQVTEKLKDNDSIDWHFYEDEEEALEDTRVGLMYATFVLPADLSENLLGMLEGSDAVPALRYYPNEKYNAVATKVTDSAAQTLIRQINQGFSSTVNEKVLATTQKISDEVEEKADKTNQSAIAEIKAIQADLEKVVTSLDDAGAAITGWRTAASGASEALGVTADQLPTIAAALDQASEQLNAFRGKTGEFESSLSAAILKSAAAVSEMSAKAVSTLSQATADLQAVKTQLEALEEAASGNPGLELLVLKLEVVEALCESALNGVSERVDEINNTVQDMTGGVTTATNQINDEVMPQLNSGSYEMALSLSQLSGAVRQFEPQIYALQGVLAQTDSSLVDAMAAIADSKTQLSAVSKNLQGSITDIGTLGSALEIEWISDLLDSDPANVGTFISSPVQLVTEKVYPVSNYGTAIAPFYTNLALWVGCFILVSLMKVEVTGFAGATARQRYFGRWLLFVILSLLQSQVICGVDILIGIDCANPVLFMLAGAVCSFAYMNLIFALVKTFRNIGKTLCIFLLIMQVPGSSGMYPIEIMPDFFQFIHPALPFTYGIDAMREALSGLYGTAYLTDLAVVLLIVPTSLAIGLALRPAMTNLLLLFDEEMSKVGFFASEEYEEGMETNRIRGVMRALVSHGAYADDIEERAWKFRRVHSRLRKAGTAFAFAIPFVFLFIMLPFNLLFDLSTDVKITCLVIMLVLLLIVQFALVVLEYMNRTITEETKLLGEQLIDDELLAQLASVNSALDVQDALEEPAPPNAGVVAGSEAGQEASSEGMVPATKALAARADRGGPIRDIFTTDMRLGFQSAVGVVVVMLLVVTPAMYAWFNIAGSWNPYGSTGNLKVAVANEDEGYKGDLVPITINIGDTVVSQLRANDNFNWVFVDEAEAIEGVKSGKYYAAVEIPKDFSANMLTYIVKDSDYPDVLYYTNEKKNPIAPLITQKGADSIQESIRVNFTERVDEVVLSVAYDVLDYVTSPNLSNYAAKMSRHLDDALGDTKGAARVIRQLSTLSGTVASVVDATGATIEGLKGAAAAAKGAVAEARTGIENASAAIDKAVAIVREMLDGRTFDIGKIQQIIDAALDLLEAGASAVPAGIDDAIADVEDARERATTDEQRALCDAVIKALQEAKAHAEAVPGDIAAAREEADSVIQEASADVAAVKDFFDNTVAPSIDELRSTISTISTSTTEIVSGLEQAVGGLGDSTGGLSNQLNTLALGLGKASDKLNSSATNLEATKARVAEALRSGDLKTIEDVILGGDPETLAAHLAAPIQQQREPVYSVNFFGSAMAPFYTVLSLWVGALVMISTMRVRIVEERLEELRSRYGTIRPRHEFFGRYGIFGFIGLLQGSLVLLGDMFLLHIQCENPVLFFLFGLFVGQIFCLIVYTITELFGDVGKAVCVILLIMQVAASGGTFPIEMFDPVLFNVAGFLPFYYAMRLLQECVAGIFWPGVAVDIVALLVMLGAMLVIALPLRRPFRRLNIFFEEKLEETGFM